MRPTSLPTVSREQPDVAPRTTFPLDKHTLIESAKKTVRAIVIDEGYERYGVIAGEDGVRDGADFGWAGLETTRGPGHPAGRP